MNAHHRSDRGQVLVLVVLAIVGLMGFAALAVDGGQVFSERRRSQTAADSAALAAAKKGSFPGSTEAQIKQAGIDQAKLNGFQDGGTVSVKVNHPPVGGEYCGDSEYYQVIITHQVAPIFSQFVFAGTQAVTSEAVVRATDITQLSNGNAIHALSPDDDALKVDGNTKVDVKGGNMFSNGGGVKDGGSGHIKVVEGGIYTVKDWVVNGGGENVDPSGDDTGNAPQSLGTFEAPWCPATASYGAGAYTGLYGVYNGTNVYLHDGINTTTVLQPGIHCIRGDIRLTNSESLSGEDVLLIMLDGGISMTGQAHLNLTRDSNIKDKLGNQYGGLLLYAPSTNTSYIDFGGGSDSTFQGTILVPKGTCGVGGNTVNTAPIHAQLVCWKVHLHGDGTVNIVYKAEENVQLPASIDVTK